MDERAKIEERLRRKEVEIQGLDEKIRATRVYVQALRDVLKMLDAGDREPLERQADAPDKTLRPGSAVAQARDIILKRGEPVHINDLLSAQGKVATRDSRASLTSSLSAYVRRGEIFTRPAPNTFGLIELQHQTEPIQPEEPPAGFGKAVEAPARLAKEVDEEIPY